MDITRQDYRPAKRARLEEAPLTPLSRTNRLQQQDESKVATDHLSQFQSGPAAAMRSSYYLPDVFSYQRLHEDPLDTTTGFSVQYDFGADQGAGLQTQDTLFTRSTHDVNILDLEYVDDSSAASIPPMSTSMSYTTTDVSELGQLSNAFIDDIFFNNPSHENLGGMVPNGALPLPDLFSPQVNGDLKNSIPANACLEAMKTWEQATTETICFGMVSLYTVKVGA